MRKYRLLSFFMAMILSVLSIRIEVFAGNEKSKGYISMTEDNMEGIITKNALEWLKLISPEKEYDVYDVRVIYNSATNTQEYTVSVFEGVNPYGYIVLGVESQEIVILEANINKGQEGIYTETVEHIVENEDIKRREINISDIIEKKAPMNYGLSFVSKNGKADFADSNKGVLNDISNIGLMTYEEYEQADSIFIKATDFIKPTNYEVEGTNVINLGKFNPRPALLTQAKTMELTGKYACGIQALSQIAFMENMTEYTNPEFSTNFNKLWDYCNTEIIGTSGGVTYGQNADIEELSRGFVNYAKWKGYSGTTYKGVEENPSVAWIKDKLTNNRPIIMGYSIMVDGGESAHAISIIGYVRAKKVSSGNTWNYLRVYDGWTNAPVYLNYSCVDFGLCDASYFWVKE